VQVCGNGRPAPRPRCFRCRRRSRGTIFLRCGRGAVRVSFLERRARAAISRWNGVHIAGDGLHDHRLNPVVARDHARVAALITAKGFGARISDTFLPCVMQLAKRDRRSVETDQLQHRLKAMESIGESAPFLSASETAARQFRADFLRLWGLWIPTWCGKAFSARPLRISAGMACTNLCRFGGHGFRSFKLLATATSPASPVPHCDLRLVGIGKRPWRVIRAEQRALGWNRRP